MKRIALVLAVLFIIATTAQPAELGFTGGLNMANQTGDWTENKTLLTFGGGAFGSVPLAPQISVQAEVLYMMKGTKWDYEEDGISIEEKFKLTYLEIPVLFKYEVPMEGSISPLFFAGPALGILLSAKVDVAGIELDVKDFTKGTDFGVVFGGGAAVKAGEKAKVMFAARYTLGLSNLNDDPDDPDFSFKNGVISVFGGFAFGFGP